MLCTILSYADSNFGKGAAERAVPAAQAGAAAAVDGVAPAVKDPRNTAQRIGEAVTALILLAGVIALYYFSISGMSGEGAFSGIGFKANLAICATLGSIEILTILGLVLYKKYG